jgi:hypothetical protein
MRGDYAIAWRWQSLFDHFVGAQKWGYRLGTHGTETTRNIEPVD